MKLAIPIHEERISSVFDVARKFGFFVVNREHEIVDEEFSIAEPDPLDKTRQIIENGSDVLICGAISWPLELTLISTGVVVIPNTCGLTVEVINAFLAGGLDEKAFLMPGCTGQRRCRGCFAVRGFAARRGSSSGRTDGRYRPRNMKKMKEKEMKVAVTATRPNLDGALDPRFGRCAYFMIVDMEDMSFEAVVNPNVALGGGAGIQSAQLMAEKGVKAVLTGNCGPNAHKTLTAAGVDVIVGMSGTISEAVEQYKKGGLKAAGGPNVEDHSGMNAGGPAGQSSNKTSGETSEQIPGQSSDPSVMGPMGGQGAGLGRGQGMGRGGGRGGGQGMGRGGGRGGGQGMGRGGGRGGGQGMGRGGGRGGGGQGKDRGGGRGRGGGGRR